jgi:uncharacterized membrane protein YkvA (DUF1232 family)
MSDEQIERGFFRDLVRLMKAWMSGTYRVFPWASFLMLVYIASPLDFIPEWLPIIGVLDDAAMVGFLIRSLRKDIEKFVAWENSQVTQTEQPKQQPATPSDIVDAEFVDVKDGPIPPRGELKN